MIISKDDLERMRKEFEDPLQFPTQAFVLGVIDTAIDLYMRIDILDKAIKIYQEKEKLNAQDPDGIAKTEWPKPDSEPED